MDRKWCVLFLEQTSLIASETNEPLSPGDQIHTHYRLHTSKLHTHLSFTNTDVPPTPHQSHTHKYQPKKHFKQCSWRHIQFLIHKHAFCCTFVSQISQATLSALFHSPVLTCKCEFVVRLGSVKQNSFSTFCINVERERERDFQLEIMESGIGLDRIKVTQCHRVCAHKQTQTHSNSPIDFDKKKKNKILHLQHTVHTPTAEKSSI